MLFEGTNYLAEPIDTPTGGLVVISRQTGKIVRFTPDHPQCAAYIDLIRNALDHDEADDFCRTLTEE